MSYFTALIVTLLASAFFSGLEFAFISANKLKLALQQKQGGPIASLLSLYYRKPSQFLATTLTGNNIAMVFYGITMAKILEPYLLDWFSDSEILVQLILTLISTILILIVGEFLPKNLFRLNPNGILHALALPFAVVYGGLWIFVVFIVFLSKILLKLFFRLDYKDEEQSILEKVDLQHYLEENLEVNPDTTSTSNKEPAQEENTLLIQKTLELTHTKIRECMVPRTEISGIEQSDEIGDIKQKFIDTKHSKLVVYEEDIDHIIGYVHHQDILRNNKNVWEIMAVPETMPAVTLLQTFMRNRKSIAYVVDEFGGTAGLVTLEDIIEEIFGEIEDEHDAKGLIDKKIDKRNFRFSARLEIDFLNEKYNLQIPEGDYETLSGYIIHIHESIPSIGDMIETTHFEFKILDASQNRIKIVLLRLKDDF
ncbi:MAG: hemolysin family protein [Chitinophagales bacterium]